MKDIQSNLLTFKQIFACNAMTFTQLAFLLHKEFLLRLLNIKRII